MNRKLVLMLTLTLLVGTLHVAFNVQRARASGTIYIRADGSIDPSTAPITTVDNVTYILTGNITSDADGIAIERDNIIVDGAGYTVQGTGGWSYVGIFFTKGSNVTIKNTNVKRFGRGISLDGSSNNSIVGNTVTNNGYGIWLDSSNIYGDYLGSSSSNSIAGNNIANNDNGVYLYSSSNNSVFGNNITANNEIGVYLSHSSNNVFRDNSMADNRYSFGVFGDSLSGFVNDVDVSNTVDGKPVYYWVERSYEAVQPNAGYVALVNCTGITVQGLTLADNTQGILVAYTRSSTIENNSITNTYSSGIYFYASSNNSIVGNNITNNSYKGIWLEGSSNYNSIVGNNITGNSDDGIALSESSNYDSISENSITNNGVNGISLDGSSNTTISRNNITGNYGGIDLYYSNYDSIGENSITNNSQYGIYFYASSNNSIVGNNITNNNGLDGGIYLSSSSNNNVVGNNIANNKQGIWVEGSSNIRFWHNNFIDNTQQVRVETSTIYANVWDDGYPSGGNYWSNYSGVDEKSGPNQDLPGIDSIGDTPHTIDENNRDRYPLMNPWNPPEHDLAVSITAPVYLQLGSSTSLNATATNKGLNDEVNVEFLLLINGTITNSTIIPLLQPGNSYTLSCLWTPTVKGKYNVTAYARPVPGEASIEDNQEIEFATISPPPEVGVKTGDWIKCDYTISGWPAGTPYPEWLKVEFLSVEGTNATVRVTMHISDGTEQNATVSVDVVAGGGTFQGLSGFVIPANCTTGDSIHMSGYGNVTIAGETTSSYAGATRTVVHASFSQYGTQLTYYWDKLTGAMVEASVVSGGVTATGKATETNMWQAESSGLPIDPIYLYVLAALAIVIAVGAAAFIIRRKKKPPEEVENS